MRSKSICFSPTHSTEKVVTYIKDELGFENECYDISYRKNENLEISLTNEDILVVGMPVHGGRIPGLAVERFKNIKGDNTPAIILVTYGNRGYDDALLELKNLVESQGFKTIAAAAIVTEHSIFNDIGSERPDKDDCLKIKEFTQEIKNKLKKDDIFESEILVKGNEDYVEYKGLPLKPKSNPRMCIGCAVCSKGCPVGAITSDDLLFTDESLCITCMRCIRDCPENARNLPAMKSFIAEKTLKQKCRERKEPEFII